MNTEKLSTDTHRTCVSINMQEQNEFIVKMRFIICNVLSLLVMIVLNTHTNTNNFMAVCVILMAAVNFKNTVIPSHCIHN